MKKFKVNMQKLRKTKGINQSELAKLMNTDQRVISQYETGAVTPSLERLVEIAQILDVSLDELIEFKRIQRKLSKELIE